MSERFRPGAPSIHLPATVKGPNCDVSVPMILDTGASRTVVTWEVASACGYDPGASGKRVRIVTASGAERCPEIVLTEFIFLQRHACNFPVLCHPLPSELGIDGIVGLDFFRATKLTIDFRIGEVTLEM